MNGTKHPTASAAAGAVCRAVVLFAGGVVLSAAVAEEFSWEVAGRYEDMDMERAVESSRSSLHATYYFSSVDDQAGPYELAPFLNRSSYVTVATARSRQREQLVPAIYTDLFVGGTLPDDALVAGRFGGTVPPFQPFPSESGIDTSEFAVEGRYVWPGTGWYAGAQTRRSDAEVLPDLFFAQTTMDSESAGLFAGRYIGSRTTLELGVGSDSLSQEVRAKPFGIDPIFAFSDTAIVTGFESITLQTGVETETENLRLSLRHVGDLGGSTYSLSAIIRSSSSDTRLSFPAPPGIIASDGPFGMPDRGFSIGIPDFTPLEFFESESERQFHLSGALFPARALGVRLTFSNTNHDTFGSSDLVALSANWFFVRDAALEIELVRTSSGRRYPFGLSDIDAAAVRLIGRF